MILYRGGVNYLVKWKGAKKCYKKKGNYLRSGGLRVNSVEVGRVIKEW